MQYKLKTLHYFLFLHNVLSFVWCGPHNLLETTWKQARNERLKVHEMEQLY
jgi:hypothetical protein